MNRRQFVGHAVGVAALTSSRWAGAQNFKGDEALSKILIEGEDWQVVAEGFQFTDAATSDPDGNFYFADLRASRVFRIDAKDQGGKSARPAAIWTGSPKISGLKIGVDGRLYAATQGENRRILAYDLKAKKETVLASDVKPNDLVVTRTGRVYFTDTDAGDVKTVDPGGSAARSVAKGIKGPNGITLSPDQASLFVSEMNGDRAWAFRVESNGDLSHGSPWMELRCPVDTEKSGGDGMTVDVEGRIYISSLVGVQMFDWTGRMGGVLSRPSTKAAVSCAFAGPGRSYLYLCATDRVFRRRLNTAGASSALPADRVKG